MNERIFQKTQRTRREEESLVPKLLSKKSPLLKPPFKKESEVQTEEKSQFQQVIPWKTEQDDLTSGVSSQYVELVGKLSLKDGSVF